MANAPSLTPSFTPSLTPSLTSAIADTYNPTSATPFGSLTTPFTPPSYCSSVVFSCSPYPSCGPFEQGQTCGSDGEPSAAPDCWPRGTERFANYIYSNTAMLYQEATACPMDWTSVGTEIDSGGTTRFGCCPPNFRSTSVADGALYCSSYIDALAESVVGLECQASGTGVPMTISTLDSARPSPVWMKQIQVVMKDGVTFPTPTPTSSDPTSSSRRSGSAPASSTASNSAAPADTGSQGLSTGAIAGIAVGVTAVALILIAIAAFLLLRRRRQRGQTTTANNAGPSGVRWSSIPELAGSPRAEKYASTGTPLSHANYIAELPENRTVAELPGSK